MDAAEAAEIRELYCAGVTIDDIARALRYSPRTIHRHVARHLRDVVFDDRFDPAPAITIAGSARALAELVHVEDRTVHRWRDVGIGWQRADEIAVALGVHPGVLWPEWWKDAA